MKVKELLNAPSKWTKGAFARDIHGTQVPSSDANAESFCLLGAMNRCYPEYEERKAACIRLHNVVGSSIGITGFNDDMTTTFADIQALLERADV